MKHVENWAEYQMANAGFSYDFQLVDVQDFNGVGETEPSPYFYQNLAEAEYCVALFMFMRLIGYPANKITVLTTYNGQKHLIRDVINTRCANNPLIGRPHKVLSCFMLLTRYFIFLFFVFRLPLWINIRVNRTTISSFHL